MASGHAIGTVFVELDLDPSRYTKGQQQLYKDATQTALNIEENFKKLGIKSSAEFDLMRQKAQNAFEAIKNSSKATANDIIRAEQAKADTLKRINEQQFGHQTTLLEGLKKNWIAASAAIYAAQATIRKGWQMAKEGADFTEQFGILDNLARKYKTTADSIIADMERAANHQVAKADLMKTALGGIAKGLRPDQLTELTKAATILGDTVGEDVTTALNNMAEALESGRMKGLKRYAGTTIELKDAFGDLVDQLSATEKAQKAYNDIVILAAELQKQQTKAVDESADKIEQIEAKWKNLMTDLSLVIKRFVVENYDAVAELMDYLDPANMARRLRKSPKASGENLSPKTVGSPDMDQAFYAELDNKLLKKQAQNKKDREDAIKKYEQEREAAIKRITEETRKATYEVDSIGLSQYSKDIDRINAEADNYKKLGVDKVKIEKYVAAEKAVAAAKNDVVMREAQEKELERQRQGQREYQRIITENYEYNLNEHERAINRINAKEDDSIGRLVQLYDDGLISWEQYNREREKIQKNTTKEIIDQRNKEIQDINNLTSSFSPFLAAQNQYYENIIKIKNALKDGLISPAVAEQMKLMATLNFNVNIDKIYENLYDQIEGYDKEAYEKRIERIEHERQLNKELYGEKVANAIAAQDKINAAFKRYGDPAKQALGEWSDALENISQLYDRGSKEQERYHKAAQAFAIAQKGIDTAQAVVKGVEAVINAMSNGDPYTAVFRGAAVAAMVASYLSQIGVAFNGSSGSSSSSHLPASTVLGAEAGTQSSSISNSFEMLKDIYDIEDTKLTNIYNELRDINNNITGLVTSIVRTGGVSATGMGISTGTTAGSFENMARLPIAQNMGFLSSIGNFLNQPVLDIGNWLFGGKVKTKVTGSGISFNDQSIADVLSGGMNAMQYADIKTTKSGWFGSKKVSKSTKYGELDGEVSAMFDKVFQGMGQSLVYFAENLGTSVNDVMNYTFEKTKLDLKDMTAEEMNEAISGYISSASDNAVSALFGDIVGKYQELNEGLMETATRLIMDKEIVQSVLDDTGKAFAGTVPQMIQFSEQLIDIAGGLDNLTEAAQSYIDKFYSDAEKFASTKQSIRDVAGILPRTREDYRKLVESIDLTSEVGKEAYYTLLALSDTADGYYSHLEDLANQRADMEIELLNAQGKTAEALAASRKRELEAMDESLRPLQELIWLTQDLGTQLETVTNSVTTEINALISTSSSAASQARSMANTYKNLIETLTEAQVKIFGGGKAGAQTRLNDIFKSAMTGDADALGKMPSAIDTLLSESLASARTSLEYRRDQAKSYIALGQAAKVSDNMMNMEEYRATLLETQVKVLEDIRTDIQNNNFAELQKHSELLEDIGYLLETANAVTLTGNAQRDVIKNLDAINTSYTSEMLTELVSGGTSQTNSLLSILSSSQTIVSLLGQLVSLNEANEQAIAQKEIAMNQAEYNAALSETSAALSSLQAARAATASASEIANIEASQYMQANYVAGVASNYYAQNPTAANKADMEKYLAIANTEYSQYAAAQANLNTAQAQEKAALNIYNQSLATVAQLKEVTNALIDVYNAQYPSSPIQKFAEGGTFGGGWRVVGEKGWELEYTGPSTIVNNKDAKKLLDNSELISEVKKLNASLEKYGYYIAKYTQKSANTLDKFDRDGLPEERAA